MSGKVCKGVITMDPIFINVKLGKCDVCNKSVYKVDGIQVDYRIIHEHCFKCACCSQSLQKGDISRDNLLQNEYGLSCFCRDHMLLSTSEKTEQLVKMGRKKRKNHQ
uniref:LIM zinc-binding domain-containing protein n=1 Tax=Acrobeloides nanus TaxID=290746 RepID=A0A914C6I5_9BILA